MKHKTYNRGFTLMEVIIAIAVITIALVTSVALISFSISGIRIGKSKIVAAGLAQEGIEIVRNIRDSNWVGPTYKRNPSNWRDGLAIGDYRVQYDKSVLLSSKNKTLNIDSNGFYYYDDTEGGGSRPNSSSTSFKRTITIQHIGNNQIKVISEVTWQEKGKNYIIKAEDLLYNWLEVPET